MNTRLPDRGDLAASPSSVTTLSSRRAVTYTAHHRLTLPVTKSIRERVIAAGGVARLLATGDARAALVAEIGEAFKDSKRSAAATLGREVAMALGAPGLAAAAWEVLLAAVPSEERPRSERSPELARFDAYCQAAIDTLLTPTLSPARCEQLSDGLHTLREALPSFAVGRIMSAVLDALAARGQGLPPAAAVPLLRPLAWLKGQGVTHFAREWAVYLRSADRDAPMNPARTRELLDLSMLSAFRQKAGGQAEVFKQRNTYFPTCLLRQMSWAPGDLGQATLLAYCTAGLRVPRREAPGAEGAFAALRMLTDSGAYLGKDQLRVIGQAVVRALLEPSWDTHAWRAAPPAGTDEGAGGMAPFDPDQVRDFGYTLTRLFADAGACQFEPGSVWHSAVMDPIEAAGLRTAPARLAALVDGILLAVDDAERGDHAPPALEVAQAFLRSACASPSWLEFQAGFLAVLTHYGRYTDRPLESLTAACREGVPAGRRAGAIAAFYDHLITASFTNRGIETPGLVDALVPLVRQAQGPGPAGLFAAFYGFACGWQDCARHQFGLTPYDLGPVLASCLEKAAQACQVALAPVVWRLAHFASRAMAEPALLLREDELAKIKLPLAPRERFHLLAQRFVAPVLRDGTHAGAAVGAIEAAGLATAYKTPLLLMAALHQEMTMDAVRWRHVHLALLEPLQARAPGPRVESKAGAGGGGSSASDFMGEALGGLRIEPEGDVSTQALADLLAFYDHLESASGLGLLRQPLAADVRGEFVRAHETAIRHVRKLLDTAHTEVLVAPGLDPAHREALLSRPAALRNLLVHAFEPAPGAVQGGASSVTSRRDGKPARDEADAYAGIRSGPDPDRPARL